MHELGRHLEVLGLPSLAGLVPRDLRKVFRKRSLQLLPERHPGTMNAHSIFEELNTAFLEVPMEGLVVVVEVVGITLPGAPGPRC